MMDAAHVPGFSALPRHSPPPRTLSLLSRLHGTLGGTRLGRAVLRAIPAQRFSRSRVLSSALEGQGERPADVTVLIGVRDRTDHRLALALRCLRAQTYPAHLVQLVVVDYGSGPTAAECTSKLCREHDAVYMRVEADGPWSRSRCLNAGIRRAETRYLLTSDADVLLSPDFLGAAVDVLRTSPLSLVCGPMLDLPEHSVETVGEAATRDGPLPVREWKSWASPRLGWDFHPSLTVAHTIFYQLIRGYDEYYEVWGNEDTDLWKRLTKLGLERHVIDPSTAFYLHQWHPKYENLPDSGREQAIRKNRQHYKRLHSLIRNGPDWGRGGENIVCERPSRAAAPAVATDG